MDDDILWVPDIFECVYFSPGYSFRLPAQCDQYWSVPGWLHNPGFYCNPLCSHFRLSCGNQAMTKSAHWWSWSCDYLGNLGGVFSCDNTPKDHTETHKISLFFI